MPVVLPGTRHGLVQLVARSAKSWNSQASIHTRSITNHAGPKDSSTDKTKATDDCPAEASANKEPDSPAATKSASKQTEQSGAKKKSIAQLDQELMQKMAGLAGDGGESGIEYEDGKPVAMKRGVRENMFRYI